MGLRMAEAVLPIWLTHRNCRLPEGMNDVEPNATLEKWKKGKVEISC